MFFFPQVYHHGKSFSCQKSYKSHLDAINVNKLCKLGVVNRLKGLSVRVMETTEKIEIIFLMISSRNKPCVLLPHEPAALLS